MLDVIKAYKFYELGDIQKHMTEMRYLMALEKERYEKLFPLQFDSSYLVSWFKAVQYMIDYQAREKEFVAGA